ncbi:DNA-directed RNA polymerase subunit beta [Gorillibacterium massiliense]|uniref:DNA-directed RNA polymerase subunit beta n=1 Tax=Gorillibacterium massiliense TaxID=1280390 RepID=UPI0004B69E2F|nr:DNA-directed RNA polymerase subunit beta [Gorillibacterium massiliense]
MQDSTNRYGKLLEDKEDDRNPSPYNQGMDDADDHDYTAEMYMPDGYRQELEKPNIKPKAKEESQHPGPAASGKKPAKKKKKKRHPVLRVLRFLIVPLLCLIALGAGLVVGYTYIGDHPMSDVWHWETWKHVWDLVYAK